MVDTTAVVAAAISPTTTTATLVKATIAGGAVTTPKIPARAAKRPTAKVVTAIPIDTQNISMALARASSVRTTLSAAPLTPR